MSNHSDTSAPSRRDPQPSLPTLRCASSEWGLQQKSRKGLNFIPGPVEGVVNLSVNGTRPAAVASEQERKARLRIGRPFREDDEVQVKLISSRSQGPGVPCRH